MMGTDTSTPLNPTFSLMKLNVPTVVVEPRSVPETTNKSGIPIVPTAPMFAATVNNEETSETSSISPSPKVVKFANDLPGRIRNFLNAETMESLGGVPPEIATKLNDLLYACARHLESDLDWYIKTESVRHEN